jgi:hypothetical protein
VGINEGNSDYRMKHYQWIRIRADGFPKAVFDAVAAVWPAGVKTSVWETEFLFEGFVEDAERGLIATRILEICQQAGLCRSDRGLPGTYGHHVQRIYDPEDLRGVEHLLLLRQREIQGPTERNVQGRLLLAASRAKASIKCGRIFPNWVIVADVLRRALEPHRFVGLEFKPVEFNGRSAVAKEPFWELCSSVVMPKLVNDGRLIQIGLRAAEPFSGDYSRIVMVSEPPYANPEAHFRAIEVQQLGPFDVAHTFEKFIEPHPATIVSQRFYQACQAAGCELRVQPVRLVD